MSQKDLSRRDFLKLSGVAAGTLAIAASGVASLPTIALADTTLAAGNYKVTCDVYVDKSDNFIKLVDAYLTNPNSPADGTGLPSSSYANNCDLTVDSNGRYSVVVPIVNNTFGLIKIGGASEVDATGTDTTGKNTVKVLSKTDWSAGGHTARIDMVQFDFDGSETFDFSNCQEYSNYSIFKKDRYWDLHVYVHLDSAVSA